MVRFNLFCDVKVDGVASIYKFSSRLVRMYNARKSFVRFYRQKVQRMSRKVLIMQYRNQQLVKSNGRVRFLRNGNRIDQWSPVHWNPEAFLPRKTLKKEYKLWTRPLQICLYAVSTTGCLSSFKKQTILLGSAILQVHCTQLFADWSAILLSNKYSLLLCKLSLCIF